VFGVYQPMDSLVIIRRRANHPWDQRYHCATW